MFYETQHSSADTFGISDGHDLSFPPHIHEAFELIAVTEGTMRIFVEDREYLLSAGDAVLVFPDEVHAIETPAHSRNKLIIFSPKFINAFITARQTSVPERHDFRPSETLSSMLTSLSMKSNTFMIKGILYLAAAEFDEGRAYKKRISEKNELLMRIFNYVSEHFAEECSLASLSEAMAYSYVYLSRYFKERTKMSFTDYVSFCRINEACYRLVSSDESVTNVAISCGFDSLRSFHRNFKAATGKTPVEYRKKTDFILRTDV